MKKLIVARNTGFCFGVRRTVQTAERLLEKHKCLYSIGDIVHNPLVMNSLKAKGLKVVSGEREVKRGPFIVRSHGIGPDTICRLKKRGVEIYDATCPSVKKIHSLIKKLDRKKYLIIIIGNENHPEVVALKEYGSNVCVLRETTSCSVKNNNSFNSRIECGGKKEATKRIETYVEAADDAANKTMCANSNCYKAAVIGQTTLSFKDYFKTACSLVRCTDFKATVVYNTICRVTGERQDESAEISRTADMVFVLGGKTSSNTAKLHQTCSRFNKRVMHIETPDELEGISLAGVESVGLISGTSTPEDFIFEVKEYMKKKGYGEVRHNEHTGRRKTS